MFANKLLLALTCLLFYSVYGMSQQANQPKRVSNGQLDLIVLDASNRQPLVAAVALLKARAGETKGYTSISDDKGLCEFRKIPPGTYILQVLYMGTVHNQVDVKVTATQRTLTVPVHIDPKMLKEVVITATEPQGMTSASKIGRAAMSHLQPSSFADLLELLPGGSSKDPSFSSASLIRLREVDSPPTSGYSTSSLGTAFVVDGVPINTDADQLYSAATNSITIGNTINDGVDMRTLTTDDIQEVEIVRGIPSVEYGDLTSGLVKITRKKGGSRLEARFKADMKSKLFYAGKGFEWGTKDKLMLNLGFNYLDSKSTPTNTRFNYKRLGGLARLNKEWSDGRDYVIQAGTSVDYTGTIQKDKTDRDLDRANGMLLEKYKRNYNRISWQNTFSITPKNKTQFFRGFDLNAALTGEFSKIDQWAHKIIAHTGGYLVLKVPYKGEGEYDVPVLTEDYDATMVNRSNPFYAYAKAVGIFGIDAGEWLTNKIRLGVDWRMDKNYGDGLEYDPNRPFSETLSQLPRPYDEIPAQHDLAFFLEENAEVRAGRFRFGLQAGLRTATMLNLDKQYAMHGHFYLDPRVNAQIDFPSFELGGKDLIFKLTGGLGWHTKMPTVTQLYPEMDYYSFMQLNTINKDDKDNPSRAYIKAFKYDPTNFNLKPARNFKWELRADVNWGENLLSVTYFREDMKTAFRNIPEYTRFVYKQYSAMSGNLEDIPYTEVTDLEVISKYGNGSRIRKSGVEFTLSTMRFPVIRTKLTINGAYFLNRYTNSGWTYDIPHQTGLNSLYVGAYKDDDLMMREQFTTNFMLDTQIPRLGLIFSTNFQCMWFNGNQNTRPGELPDYYIDSDGKWFPYPEDVESITDPTLKLGLKDLVRNGGAVEAGEYEREPFYMCINFKVSKKLFGDKMTGALFVNKILNVLPDVDVVRGSNATKRHARPYFGMEINFNI